MWDPTPGDLEIPSMLRKPSREQAMQRLDEEEPAVIHVTAEGLPPNSKRKRQLVWDGAHAEVVKPFRGEQVHL